VLCSNLLQANVCNATLQRVLNPKRLSPEQKTAKHVETTTMAEYDQIFSDSQLRTLDIVARVSSCLSLSGSSFTIISFLSYPPLRKPVNRLAFSIAVANIFACLAYSWGQFPIHAGRHSAWCQTQGFFINWFVMTDPLLVGHHRSRFRVLLVAWP
jgi:hypothetical protein